MLVKVIQCSNPNYWYSDKIGQTYEVVGVNDNVFEAKLGWTSDYKTIAAQILKEDCEEIYKLTRVAEPARKSNGKARPDNTRNLFERSGFNTKREISYYEKLNGEAEVSLKKTEKEEE